MHKHVSVVLTLLALGSVAPAQWRKEENQGLGIQFKVFKKLKEIPMKLGVDDPHQRARFQPDNDGDYIYGRYGKFSWQLEVYEFDPQKKAAKTSEKDPKDKVTKEERAANLARLRFSAKNFKEWVKVKDRSRSKRKFFIEGKHRKGSSKRPAYDYWEYSDGQAGRDPGTGKQIEHRWYHQAAVYEIRGRQIALIVVLPVKKKDKPDKRYMGYAKTMVTSLRAVEGGDTADAGADRKRDQYAVTEAQKKELARLKKNIADFDNWNYFTTPNYIITYSWDKPNKRVSARKFARGISDRLEEIRTKFIEYFPPHEKQVKNYSVIRVCADYDDFLKYSNTRPGVVGWFSPGTKELCVFYDTQKLFGDEEYIIGVCYHEAWHQYSDGYWPDRELHRWYDEGLAEFFNQQRMRGKRWKFEYLRGRFGAIRRQINEETFIPAREIVTWFKRKFYGPRAADHYAQAYAMVDMLMRGKKRLGKKWDPVWGQIMPTYNKVAMAEKDTKKATLAAFKGVDFEKFDAAWIDWVKSGKIKR